MTSRLRMSELEPMKPTLKQCTKSQMTPVMARRPVDISDQITLKSTIMERRETNKVLYESKKVKLHDKNK